jgi:acyl-CoA synthetase (AMP-forming)/AMP-acid ligase II
LHYFLSVSNFLIFFFVRDENGYYQITGRVDDVINVTGHRLGTAEVEDVMVNIKTKIDSDFRNFLYVIFWLEEGDQLKPKWRERKK